MPAKRAGTSKSTTAKRGARPAKSPTAARRGPRINLSPKVLELAVSLEVSGTGWDDCPIELIIADGTFGRIARVIAGEQHDTLVKATGGEFSTMLDIRGLEPGEHRLVARSTGAGKLEAAAVFTVLDVPEIGEDGRPTLRWQRRTLDFLDRRFPGGRRRPGARIVALQHRDAMRLRDLRRLLDRLDPDQPSPPVNPGTNWYPIGPSVVLDGQVFGTTSSTFVTAPISGRVTDIAIDPNSANTIYAATAQGGLWRSLDAGANWEPLTDFAASLACGSVTVDPSATDASGRSTRLLVGTGEPNNSDSYYGAGMLFSSDGGANWQARGTSTFTRAAFSAIAVDPANNHHLVAATDQGVYESMDEGVNWTLVDSGTSYDLVVDWSNAAGAEVYVARSGVGIRRRVGTGAWSTLAGGLPATVNGRVALAMAPSDANTLYAAIPGAPSASGNSTVTFYKTTNGGTSWTAAGATVTAKQVAYNLVLGVHTTDPTIVLFGEVGLWRTTNSGGAWTLVSTGSPGIHADQHAVCFHPTDGNKVYAGNDGGAWYSSNAGVAWEHRNKDLATLQYFGIAPHGQYEAVMLGGTQDNGAQRYASHPAWWHSALGDGAFCAIDSTSNMYRWFETRWYSFPCFRSDTAGAAGSWVSKTSGITTNGNWFYPPFAMDPNDSTVLYSGFDRLWRSTNSGDSWTDVSGVISAGSNITAIAVSPSNSNNIVVGLQNGRVYRVSKSGTTWSTTDISASPLPAGQISDLAVHPTDTNTIYATTADLIFGEGSESFAADHVYRTTDGGTHWASRSTGLSQANPVNAIVIDPLNTDTLFIGCDVGIFRSTNGGGSWSTWDQGLPNCSVQDLILVPGQRLLRAGTHGRSVWERPIDAASTQPVQLYVRDNLLDTGRTTPSPSNVAHPFDPTDWVFFWQSADIKIDSPDPSTNTYAFGGLDIDYVQFEKHVHDNPRRDTYVRAYAQVHCRGTAAATNVRVRGFWADASAYLPNLPADFWTAFPNSDPTNTADWHPIGPTITVPSVAPGHPRVVGWSWLVPANAATHTCLLVVTTCDEDPINVTSLDPATAINGSNHVTLKNLHVDNVVTGAQGMDTSSTPAIIQLGILKERSPMDIRFNVHGLPAGSVIHCVLPAFEMSRSPKQTMVGMALSDAVPKALRRIEQFGCGEPIEFDTSRAYTLEVDAKHQRGEQSPGLFGIVPTGDRFAAAFVVDIPRSRTTGTARLHVEQWFGGRLVGGSTYEFRRAARRGRTG